MFSAIKLDLEPLTESERNVVAWFKRYELRFKFQLQHLQAKPPASGDKDKPAESSVPLDHRLELLPLFLSDPVLTAFEGLKSQDRSSYEDAKIALINRYATKPRQAYEDFVTAKLQVGMTVDGFVDQLKQSLQRAVDGLSAEQVDDMVLHQFLLSLPMDKKEQLLLATEKEGSKLRLAEVLEKARSLTLVRPVATSFAPTPAAPVTASAVSAAMAVKGDNKGKRRCYNCNEYGHMAAECKKPKKAKNPGTGAQGSR
jgi:hypothetical protein